MARDVIVRLTFSELARLLQSFDLPGDVEIRRVDQPSHIYGVVDITVHAPHLPDYPEEHEIMRLRRGDIRRVGCGDERG